jgi:hypothetical protein
VPYEFVPHTGMRKVIAKRLTEAKQTMPHFYLTVDCEIDALLKIRADLNSAGRDQYKLSVNDFVIRASALALKKVPAANASFSDEGTLLWQRADIVIVVDRRRPGRLCRRDPRGAARHEDVAVVEREHLGGICLNWGCIPTKALLRTSEINHLLHHLDEFGFTAEDISFDIAKIVEALAQGGEPALGGVKHLLKKNKVTVFDGTASSPASARSRSRRTASRSPT